MYTYEKRDYLENAACSNSGFFHMYAFIGS